MRRIHDTPETDSDEAGRSATNRAARPRRRGFRARYVAAASLLAVAALSPVLAACGGDDDSGSSADDATSARVVVSAATSLKRALTAYGDDFASAQVRTSFAGSDALAAQIREGLRPDVFASANTKLPDALFAEGLVERPVTFATNELVLAVPKGDDAVESVGDLAKDGVTIAIGAKDVPVGDYTRTVLDRLPKDEARAILGNVRSEEPDVGGVVGKLTQGAVDAGFVYASDVRGAGGAIRAIRLPARLEPTVAYGVAIVKGGKNPSAAKAYVRGLLSGTGAEDLRTNGFGPPPSSS